LKRKAEAARQVSDWGHENYPRQTWIRAIQKLSEEQQLGIAVRKGAGGISRKGFNPFSPKKF
jgi:hypothetical protein